MSSIAEILKDQSFSLEDWFERRFMAGYTAPFVVARDEDRVDLMADIAQSCPPTRLQELRQAVSRAVEDWVPQHGTDTLCLLAEAASMAGAFEASSVLARHLAQPALWPQLEWGPDAYLRAAMGIETAVAALAGMAISSVRAQRACYSLFGRAGSEFFLALLAPPAAMHDPDNWMDYFHTTADFALGAEGVLSLHREEVAFDVPVAPGELARSFLDLREVMTRMAGAVDSKTFVRGIARSVSRGEDIDRVAVYLARELRLTRYDDIGQEVGVSADFELMSIHEEDPLRPQAAVRVPCPWLEELQKAALIISDSESSLLVDMSQLPAAA